MKLNRLERDEYNKYLSIYDFSEFLKDKTILVTGSKGIVGSGIIRWILYENENRGNNTHVIASSRNPERRPEFVEDSDNIRFCRFGEENYIVDHLDYIIHTASPTSNKVFTEQPVETLKTIIGGTEKILDLVKKQEKCSMIYVSSEEVYGTPKESKPVLESYVGAIDSMNIRNCYPMGKKTSELLCKAYYEEYGIDVKIIRPTVILGLFQPYDSVKVEAEIIRCILENKNLYMKSNGMTKKCAIYTMDVLSAILTVLFKGKAGEVYNATNPETFETVKDRAYNAFSSFNPNVTIVFANQDDFVANSYLPQRSLQEDISKICKLGWKPNASMNYIFEVDINRFLQKHN